MEGMKENDKEWSKNMETQKNLNGKSKKARDIKR